MEYIDRWPFNSLELFRISGYQLQIAPANATVHTELARFGGGAGGLVGRATVINGLAQNAHGNTLVDQIYADN